MAIYSATSKHSCPDFERRGGFASLPSFYFPVSHRKEGMSLVSLLVALVIAAILAALLLGGAKGIMESFRGTKCANNLRQLGVATQLYTAEHNGYLPFHYTSVTSTGAISYTYTGSWYWLLAPYLNVPRWETNKTYLGPKNGKILDRNVFSCPAHGKNEIAMPLIFPTNIPVSYAPSVEIGPAMTPLSNQENPDALVKGLRVQDVPLPAQKAWLSDSTLSNVFNPTVSRWTSNDDKVAWARVPFTRHSGAGNILFYDGHVERITYRSMVTGDIRANVLLLFRP